MSAYRVIIIGYGNVGRGVHKAIDKNSDMELVGIFSRGVERVEKELEDKGSGEIEVVDASADIDFPEILAADVAVLCGGSKDDLPVQGPKFARYYNTVDSFDTHDDIPGYFQKLDAVAQENGNIAIVSTGWDPGTFSEERVKADAFLPGAALYTFWGPGVSQGHSDAARQVEGVIDARQYTLPVEEALKTVREGNRPELGVREKHRRVVYVLAEEDADRERIAETIKQMPAYYEPYDTEIFFISAEEMEAEHSEMPHGGFVMASGETGTRNRALIEYSCKWGSNPEATANILVAYARAAARLGSRGERGARTVLDICPVDLSPRSREELLASFV